MWCGGLSQELSQHGAPVGVPLRLRRGDRPRDVFFVALLPLTAQRLRSAMVRIDFQWVNDDVSWLHQT